MELDSEPATQGGMVASAEGNPPAIYIGTSGYNFSYWRKGVFYPKMVKQADELKYFSGVFPAVEINNTFHGTPREESLRKWAQNSSKGFTFAVKVLEDITHKHRLARTGIEDTWNFFYERIKQNLANKMGPVLFQLPPSFKKDVAKLEELAKLIPVGCRVVMEFRSDDWYCQEVFDVMRTHNMAICQNITPDKSMTLCEEVTADFTYTRFHKRKGEDHFTNYDAAALKKAAETTIARRDRGLDQFMFFMNDVDGMGPKNAQSLMELLAEAGATKLVHNWKPAPVIKKGGKGSIQSFFGAKKKKPAEAADAARDVKRPKIDDTPKTHPASPQQQTKSPQKPKKGTLGSYFSPKKD